MKNYSHAVLVMNELQFPSDAKSALIKAEEKLFSNRTAQILYKLIYRDYWVRKKNFRTFAWKCKLISRLIDEHIYTVNFLILLNCTEPLLDEYKKAGISEDVYWNTLFDLKAKLLECKEVHNIWGTFVENWFLKFYKLERFGLGRFQYEFYKFTKKSYKKHGVSLKPGDFAITMHIPSHSQSLTYDVRMESYKRAYEFFADKLQNGKAIFTCDSWLMYPDNCKILPETSNMCDFLHDFDVIDFSVKKEFKDAWRVFGADAKKPASQLPRNTTMQRCFAQWLEKGNSTGVGYGVLIFDGDRILTRKLEK